MSDHRKNINKIRSLKQQTREMREQLLTKLDPKAKLVVEDRKEDKKEVETPKEVADLEDISTIEMEANPKDETEPQPELALDIEEDFWVQVEESAVLRRVKKGFWNWSSAQE
jgi:hypothetical protein